MKTRNLVEFEIFLQKSCVGLFSQIEKFQKFCEDKFSQIGRNSVKSAKINLHENWSHKN